MFKNKIILVTGSAGFIGFHVAKKLLELGAFIVGVDDFNDYYDISLKESRNKILEQFPKYKLYRGDLSDDIFVNRIFNENKIEKICHLAAQPGIRYSIVNPNAYIKSNIASFVNVIEAARFNNVKYFVYASSSLVYGDNKKIPFSVVDAVDDPASLYAVTKRSDELIAHVYYKNFGINVTGLRLFTVIGPYGRPDMALFLFTDAIYKGKPIKVFNFGKMRRDFTYIDDIVNGILLSLDKVHGCEIFNLGNNNPVELEYLISCLEKEIGTKAIKDYQKMQPGDVLDTYADIKYTTEKLGWKPRTSIEDAIHLFVEWYKDIYKK